MIRERERMKDSKDALRCYVLWCVCVCGAVSGRMSCRNNKTIDTVRLDTGV